MTVINTNVSALRAQNSSRLASKMQNNAMERLSSGKRINSARDDAAGLAIATRMDANARGMTQAIRNASDGISAAQTAESAMGNISNILVRMRELAMQAVNGTNSSTDREAIQVEVDALIEQIGDISKRTDFNGQSLLSGGTVTITPAVPGTPGTPAVPGTPEQPGPPVVPAVPGTPEVPAVPGTPAVNGNTFSIQTGVNDGDKVDLTIANMDATTLAVDTLDVSTSTGASSALTALDNAINTVASQRANIGAQQNRLDAAIDSLTSSVTNLQESKSRIEDADFSAESTKLAAASILSQASTAMLAQANQSQQGVLSLLR